jgi:heptosyltransferase-2
VFTNQPGIDDLWIDPPGGRVARIAARTRALRSTACDLVVVFPPSFSSAVPPWFAGVRARIGFSADGRAALLTHPLPVPSREVHLARSYRELAAQSLRGAGVEVHDDATPPRLHVSDAERASARRRVDVLAREGYAVVVPGAAFGPAKSWPAERYRALCEMLVRETHVVLVGSGKDRAVCETVAAGISGVHSVAGETSLGELFAIMEGAHVVVANDSGAPHAAAALDVPCVVLFGSTSPAWTAPVGRSVRVLQHKVHCNPCYGRTCPTQLECFHGIAVDSVFGAAMEAIGQAAPRKTVPPGQPVG